MIPKLETISTRPVQLTAPEFTNRRRLDVTYEDIERMMAQQSVGMPAGYESSPRYAMVALMHLAVPNTDVHVRNVRLAECAICTECGGFIDLFHESHTSEGLADRRYFHIACWNANQAMYDAYREGLNDSDMR